MMQNNDYEQARKEFWNCIWMAPFTLGISLVLAFKEWKPRMNAAHRGAVCHQN